MEFEDLVCPHCNKKGIPLNAFDGVYWCNCGCKWTSWQQGLIDEGVEILTQFVERWSIADRNRAEAWLKKARGE